MLLISYIFCINYLPKYGTIKVTEKSGYFYLNTNECDIDSTLHIQLKAIQGNIFSKLLYKFTNISPNSYSSTPSNTLFPIASSSDSSKKKTHTYYYSLKNDNNYPYLIIQYMGFKGDYLEIESTRANWGILLIILTFSFFGLMFLIVIVFHIYKRCRERRNIKNKDNIATQLVSPTPYTLEYTEENPYYSNDSQYNSANYNSNYPQQLQDINYMPSINNSIY